MSVTENVIPDWVWKRRYSMRFNKTTHIILGLLFGILGLVIVVVSFYVRFDIEDVCTSYIGCSGVYSPQAPLGNALNLLNIVTVAAASTSAGGLAYALSTWRAQPAEWAAVLGIQPFARRLQQWYSQDKLTKQQAEELLADLTASLRK